MTSLIKEIATYEPQLNSLWAGALFAGWPGRVFRMFQNSKQGAITTELPIEGESDKNENDTQLFDNLKWLTSREAALYLRLPSLGALRQMVYRRQIPYCKLGRSLRFSKAELDRLLESSGSNKRRIA